jgi:hypothetical protein
VRLWRIHRLMLGLFLMLLARAAGAVITGGKVIEGVYQGWQSAGAPTNGTSEVQTITFGGTPTGGTFRLAFDGFTTGNISWSATNTTLRDSVDAALEALPNVGAGGVTTAVGTMTAGIGTLTVTFAGNLGKRAVPTISVQNNSLTGTSPTLAVAETTPGVDASGLGAPIGAKLIDTTNGVDYINTGTAAAPTWTKTGTQS